MNIVRTHERLISETLHELAEGLQATGSYLSALRRGLPGEGSGAAPLEVTELEVSERAITQWARTPHAAGELRALLVETEESSDAAD